MCSQRNVILSRSCLASVACCRNCSARAFAGSKKVIPWRGCGFDSVRCRSLTNGKVAAPFPCAQRKRTALAGTLVAAIWGTDSAGPGNVAASRLSPAWLSACVRPRGKDPPQGNTRRVRRMGSSARQSDRVKDRDQTVQYSTRGSISAADKAEVTGRGRRDLT